MGELVCEGRVVHRGKTIATSEAFLRDGAGKLLAHGTETCAIFPIGKLMR
jgi:acyl-coenzyme A thioesterase PaaI-like protein